MPRFCFALGLLSAVALAAQPAEVVILRDGFTIQGNVRKETQSVSDPFSKSLTLLKAGGLDFVDDGPRMTIFSSHHKQLGEISKDVKIRPEYKAYSNPFKVRKSAHPLPLMNGIKQLPEFDEKWRRTMKVSLPGNDWDKIDQQVTYLDPYCCYIVSTTHLWTQTFRTNELSPKMIRKLLSTHPELVEKDGKPDPAKRVAIARFLKDVGWLNMAKDELVELKKAVPGPYAKETQDAFDALSKEIDQGAAELVVNEAEAALAAGRYQRATEMLGLFPEKSADARDVERATRFMARLKTANEQFAAARKHLRNLIDEASGFGGSSPYLAVGGASILSALPRGKTSLLAGAAEAVLAEMHPDSIERIEFFVNLANQVERERGMGKPPTKTPDELLATAVSGWVKGKNGATPDIALALRLWGAREMVLAYQRGGNLNERRDLAAAYLKTPNPLPLDELVQVISLLPPAEPENLNARTGVLATGAGVPDGVYRRRSAPYGEHPAGIDYVVKLPPEYQHGRAYPVIVALTQPGTEPEKFLAGIAHEADKHGYILVAPDWCPVFGGKLNGWNWDGADHDWVAAALRDTIRHFTVDNDRVFLIGAAAGADMAMDIGASHPDLFAGVVAVGPNPKWGSFFMHYWKNAQKLPFYIVSGELSGDSSLNTREIMGKWTRYGFPSLQVLYRGRGHEWFPSETSILFDWMSRKKRVNPTATLRFGNTEPIRWQIMREGDNHFYWLGAEKVNPGNLVPANVPVPTLAKCADLTGDIRGDLIAVQSQGVRLISIWIGRDMIDWSRPVKISINGVVASGWKAGGKKIDQDINVLLEDYWHRGDRRMLFLARLEFPNAN
ncbi:MAG: PHB depolymerase family esterase [Gemmataceae bacterium]